MAESPMTIEIATIGGAALLRYRQLLSPIADEYVLEFDGDTLSTSAINPSNTMMAIVSADVGVTGERIVEDKIEIGVSDRLFWKAISPAHKGLGDDSGDPITMSFDGETDRFEVGIDANRDEYSIDYNTSFSSIDAESVRTADDSGVHPDNIYRSDREQFVEVITNVAPENEIINLESEGDELKIEYKGDAMVQGAGIGNPVGDVDVGDVALFSTDFVLDAARAIKKTKPEKVTIEMGDEFPVRFKTEWPEYGLKAEYLISPRIQA